MLKCLLIVVIQYAKNAMKNINKLILTNVTNVKVRLNIFCQIILLVTFLININCIRILF